MFRFLGVFQYFATTWIIYAVFTTFRRLLFHPLSRFPGPKLAAITRLYMAYYDIVLNGSMVDHLEELHEKYGPVVRISPHQVHFNDPHAFEDIYVRGSRFPKEPDFYNAFNTRQTSFGYLEQNQAKERKDVMRSSFSRKAILKLETVIQNTVDKLVSALLAYQGPHARPANIHLAFLSTSMEVITSYCFARSFDTLSVQDFRHPMVIALETVGSVFFVGQYFQFFSRLLPHMPQWLVQFISPGSLAYGELVAGLSDQIDELLANPAILEKADHEIIYHRLLTPQPGGENGGIPSKKSLLEEAHVMIAAGTDTIGNACTVGTFYVLSDHQIHTKLVAELRTVWSDLDSSMSYERLEKLPYLTAVIKESLRMSHGVVTPLPRVVPTPTIIAGTKIPAGTVVSMGATFMHYNPRIFKDPLKFLPERWFDGKGGRDMEHYLVPFSKGPRSCLGINLAWCELYLIFANVFRKLEMEIYDTTLEDLNVIALLTAKYRGKPLHVMVKRRIN